VLNSTMINARPTVTPSFLRKLIIYIIPLLTATANASTATKQLF
jgi:hypothetical protein